MTLRVIRLIQKKETDPKVNLCTSGYRDSNPGPPTPEAGALTGLRYIPNNLVYC